MILRASKYFGIGAAIGWLLAFLGVLSTGAGHGTYYPAALMFGPFCVLWFSLMPHVPEWTIFAIPFLYGIYALLLLRGTVNGKAKQIAIAVLGFHWLMVAIAAVMVYRDENGFGNTIRMLTMAAPLIAFELALFAGLHWLLWRMFTEAQSTARD